MLGVVSAWGAEYPERGSTLWQESVLEGIGAGIRGALVREFVEILKRDTDLINERAEGFIGAEITELRGVLQGGVSSLEKANQAVASALRVLDDVVPRIAWEQVQKESPHARGDWSS